MDFNNENRQWHVHRGNPAPRPEVPSLEPEQEAPSQAQPEVPVKPVVRKAPPKYRPQTSDIPSVQTEDEASSTSVSSADDKPKVRTAEKETASERSKEITKKYKKRAKKNKSKDKLKDKPEIKKIRRKQKGKSALIITGIVLIVALLICAFGFLYFSNVLEIEEVNIVGAEHLTDEEVLQLADIPEGENLLRLDTNSIEARLKKDAWVAEVNCVRLYPHTLELRITEKKISCLVAVDSQDMKETKNWFLAEDKTWIMSVPPKDSEAAKHISPKIYEDAENCLKLEKVGLGIYPVIGAVCRDDKILEALEVPDKMTTPLRDMLRKINFENKQSYIFTLSNGVEVAFGDAEKVREKELVCLEIMDKYPGKVTYINVRVPDSPTYRTL